jgi:3-oxoacyl-[acyl-carrier protein] reductase
MTDIDLSGKVCIVTGGGRGLGRAMTLALVRAGARVSAAMHTAEDIPALTAECKGMPGAVLPMVADVRDPAQCARVVRETVTVFHGVHVLVNNAGVGMLLIRPTYTPEPPRFWEGKVEAWRTIIETNFLGPFHMTREVVPHLLEKKWGRIVNVTTSIDTMQRRGMSPYGSSKAALEGATASWAADLAGTGVTVNVLVPGGAADTHMLPGKPGDPDRAGPGRVLIDPAVMQRPIVWLASAYADAVSGMRFIAKDWKDLPPDQCRANAAGPAGFAARPGE